MTSSYRKTGGKRAKARNVADATREHQPLAPPGQGSRIPPTLDSPAAGTSTQGNAMAKGQMRSNKEKKKPKKDKEKKKGTSAYASAYHTQPGGHPIVKKD